MFGLFGMNGFGRQTTDNTEELQHYKNGVDAVEMAGNLQERYRNSYLSDLEDDIDEANNKTRIARNDLNKIKEILEATQTKLAHAEAENGKLREQQEALRETAINIAIDRKAIFNTIEYLNKKWGKNCVKSPEALEYEKQGAIILFDEAQSIRVQEFNKMDADQYCVDEMSKKVDLSVYNKIALKRQKQNGLSSINDG